MKTSNLSAKLPLSVIAQIDEMIEKFNITSPLRLAHFLAQCAHESGNFTLVTENLNYSKERLVQVFPKYFPNLAVATPYDRKPQMIANRVYASRMGNGDEASGEGFKFRGRGYIQLTGKDNYKKFGQFIGEDLVTNPDFVATKYPLMSAAFFFNSNNLWAICDKGNTAEVVTAVTKRVNGGTHGLADRQAKFTTYNQLLA
jgi:putative chitinase